MLVAGLVEPQPTGTNGDQVDIDEDLAQKAARTLHSFLEGGGKASEETLSSLRSTMTKSDRRDEWGYTQEEWDSLLQLCSR